MNKVICMPPKEPEEPADKLNDLSLPKAIPALHRQTFTYFFRKPVDLGSAKENSITLMASLP